jgi:hypothetical protein
MRKISMNGSAKSESYLDGRLIGERVEHMTTTKTGTDGFHLLSDNGKPSR